MIQTTERNKKGQFIKGHKVSKNIRDIISIKTKLAMNQPEIKQKISGKNSASWKGNNITLSRLHNTIK